MVQSFIGHAQNAINSCDNFDELVNKLGEKMDDENIGTWSIVVHTSYNNMACVILGHESIHVKFGVLFIEGYLYVSDDYNE